MNHAQIHFIKCRWVSDLHFMVQWFCLLSWRLFDGWILYWGYWFRVIQTIGIFWSNRNFWGCRTLGPGRIWTKARSTMAHRSDKCQRFLISAILRKCDEDWNGQVCHHLLRMARVLVSSAQLRSVIDAPSHFVFRNGALKWMRPCSIFCVFQWVSVRETFP